MISYYELLGMVKEGNAPERIEVSLTYGTSRIYKAEYDGDEFSHYIIDDCKDEDENYYPYLSECLLESSMFDKCITILDKEEFEDIEEICSDDTIDLDICESFKLLEEKINKLIKNQKKIIERLNNESD